MKMSATPSAPLRRVLRKREMFNGRKLMKVGMVSVGAMLASIGMELFLVPNRMIVGGMTGLSVLLAYLAEMRLGLALFLLNLPFLLLGMTWRKIGRRFLHVTAFGIAVFSLCTAFLHPLPALIEDPLPAAVLGGVALGLGIGFVVRFGGVLDAVDGAIELPKRKNPYTIGLVAAVINSGLLLAAGLLFGWELALYSLLAYALAYRMIELGMHGLPTAKLIWIESTRAMAIKDDLPVLMERQLTLMIVEVENGGEGKHVILCSVERRDEPRLRACVKLLDPDAVIVRRPIYRNLEQISPCNG